MDAIALHLEIRNAIALSDELGRHERAFGHHALARRLGAIRAALGELERIAGRSHRKWSTAKPTLIDRLMTSLRLLRGRVTEVPAYLRPRVGKLVASLERILFAELRPTTPVPAKPVLGGLPLRRVVPQKAHTVMDYVAAALLLATAKVARTRRARAVGMVLGAKLGGTTLLSDARLSVAQWIPIELHEVLDHSVGASAVLAPFVLGYRKKDRFASAVHILAGIGMIVGSLLTDYRAEHGLAYAVRSRGGPYGRVRGGRVPEVQRPLEGFASPSVLPRMDLY